jgi:uncharacterized protein with HEPN domain
MRSKLPGKPLTDIQRNIEAIGFFEGMSFDAFLQDQKTCYAVLRALEIISEASRHLPADMKSRYPDIDWRAVAGAGNVYRHDYDSVDDAVIWHTINNELTPLKAVVAAELALPRTDE